MVHIWFRGTEILMGNQSKFSNWKEHNKDVPWACAECGTGGSGIPRRQLTENGRSPFKKGLWLLPLKSHPLGENESHIWPCQGGGWVRGKGHLELFPRNSHHSVTSLCCFSILDFIFWHLENLEKQYILKDEKVSFSLNNVTCRDFLEI